MAVGTPTVGTGNSATPSVAIPAGVVAGVWIVLFVTIDASAAVFQTADWPSGFSAAASQQVTFDGQVSAVAVKRASGAESGTYTLGNLGASGDWIATAVPLTGRHATNPPVISATSVANTGPGGTSRAITANGVTALAGDDLLWLSAPDVNASGAGNGHTPPPLYTEIVDTENLWANLGVAKLENAAAGATGTVSGTFAYTSNAGYVAWLLRVPAAAGGLITVGASLAQPATVRTLKTTSLAQPAQLRALLGGSLAQPTQLRASLGGSLNQPAAIRGLAGASLTQLAQLRRFVAASVAQPAAIRLLTGSSLTQPGVVRALLAASLLQPAAVRAVLGASAGQPAQVRALAAASLAQSAQARVLAGSSLNQRANIALTTIAVGGSLSQPAGLRAIAGGSLSQLTALRALATASLAQAASIRVIRGGSLLQPSDLHRIVAASLVHDAVVLCLAGASVEQDALVQILAGASLMQRAGEEHAPSVFAAPTDGYSASGTLGRVVTVTAGRGVGSQAPHTAAPRTGGLA